MQTKAQPRVIPVLLRWKRLAVPSLFFLGVIYYGELFLKLFCFQTLSLSSVFFTLLFSLPPALLLGLVCGAVSLRRGRLLLPVFTAFLCLLFGGQGIYYRMFKVFFSLASVPKVFMVASSFGQNAGLALLAHWLPILVCFIPVLAAVLLRKKVIAPRPEAPKQTRRWLCLAAAVQLCAMGLVMCCGWGVMSLRYIYIQAAVPALETQYFGMITQAQLELRRMIFGIPPEQIPPQKLSFTAPHSREEPAHSRPAFAEHTLEIDFARLIADEQDETLRTMHQWFSQREPVGANEWTGYFKGKNLVWIVAESFSTLAMDPERTPTLWKLAHQGFVFENFYTPLWGLSTSDGEYVTTTGLIPKSGAWSYSRSAKNYMPFALGTQFRDMGYRTMAFHDYLYNYYDRNLSHPNMGYEYYALGQGLELEECWPPSDLEMMEKIVPRFVNEEQFMVYCLTVSGHLTYAPEENAMAARHWDQVDELPYDEAVRGYLASQIELELAVSSLIQQLEQAGKLEDTVIVLSGDHYPYGLSDEEYSQLLGHSVDPVFEIFENTLIIWNSELKEPVYVEKPCSSLDIMPTISNLFGLEYDSRLIMGSDILSNRSGLVIFGNYSFISPGGTYNSTTDEFQRWRGQPSDPKEVTRIVQEVQNRVAYSAAILDHDYYRLLFQPDG